MSCWQEAEYYCHVFVRSDSLAGVCFSGTVLEPIPFVHPSHFAAWFSNFPITWSSYFAVLLSNFLFIKKVGSLFFGNLISPQNEMKQWKRVVDFTLDILLINTKYHRLTAWMSGLQADSSWSAVWLGRRYGSGSALKAPGASRVADPDGSVFIWVSVLDSNTVRIWIQLPKFHNSFVKLAKKTPLKSYFLQLFGFFLVRKL